MVLIAAAVLLSAGYVFAAGLEVPKLVWDDLSPGRPRANRANAPVVEKVTKKSVQDPKE